MSSISHFTHDGVWDGQAMNSGSDRSDLHCQVQSRVPVSLDGGGLRVGVGNARRY